MYVPMVDHTNTSNNNSGISGCCKTAYRWGRNFSIISSSACGLLATALATAITGTVVGIVYPESAIVRHSCLIGWSCYNIAANCDIYYSNRGQDNDAWRLDTNSRLGVAILSISFVAGTALAIWGFIDDKYEIAIDIGLTVGCEIPTMIAALLLANQKYQPLARDDRELGVFS